MVEEEVSVNDANIIRPNQYTVELRPRSIKFYLKNHQGNNYDFKLSKLCGLINPHRILVRCKTKKVVIYLTKIEVGKQWNDIKTKSVGEVYNQLQRQSQELNSDDSDKKLLYGGGYHQSSKETLNTQKKEFDLFYIPDLTSSSSSSLSKDHDHHSK